MKKDNHKLLTLAALTTIAAGIVHVTNKVVSASAQLKEMLDFSNHNYFGWRFGKVYYTKKGAGSPLLLIHDTMPGASGYEWSRVEDKLALEHTVYTIDLLGCGRSDKPGITYTNFLYVQMLCDFTKKVIKEKTDVIASGFSSSFVIMACMYDKECFNKLMLINPANLIYHMVVSRETISNLFIDKLYYNPFRADQDIMDAYYEASHKGGYYAKYMYTSLVSKYMNINIRHVLSTLDNSIYIVSGEEERNEVSIIEDYCRTNPSIETAIVKNSKHFPHIENVEEFLDQVGTFF